jgi:colanic acid/amylovoran biosynthesis glycosyltransferase
VISQVQRPADRKRPAHRSKNGSSPSLRVAYLISQYPRLTHGFILQEVRELRTLGCHIQTFSVSAADRPECELSEAEREEYRQTFYIKAQSILSICESHLRVFLCRPSAYLCGLLFALRLGKWRPDRVLYSLFYFIEAVILGDQLRKANLSHIHSHFTSTLALLVTKMFPVTMSATIHGFREFRDPDGFHLARKLRASKFTIAISDYCRSQLMLECPPQLWDKIGVIPVGVHSEMLFTRGPQPPRAPLEILCVARLVHLKGHLLLLQALKRLAQEGHRLRLTLVGDGPDGPALRQAVEKHRLTEYVHFTGPINPAGIHPYYERAHVFALASLIEGLPVALMEAMASELPCVAPRIAGIPELIIDGLNGLLFNPANCEDLTRALRVLVCDPDLRLSMGKAARSQVIRNYNLHHNASRLADTFRRELAPTVEAIPIRDLRPVA